MTINMVIDRYWVQRWYGYDIHAGSADCPIFALHQLNFHVLVGDSVWNPPGGVFDPKILSQPGVLSNVENGFGFVGGGYDVNQALRPSRKAVEDACFYYAPPPG